MEEGRGTGSLLCLSGQTPKAAPITSSQIQPDQTWVHGHIWMQERLRIAPCSWWPRAQVKSGFYYKKKGRKVAMEGPTISSASDKWTL